MALVPVLIIPMMLFAGFFVGQDKIPYYFYEFKYISPIKYGFQAGVVVIDSFPILLWFNLLQLLERIQ